MKELVGSLVSVHTGNNEDLSKDAQASVKAELDGFVGDKHRGFTRVAWPRSRLLVRVEEDAMAARRHSFPDHVVPGGDSTEGIS